MLLYSAFLWLLSHQRASTGKEKQDTEQNITLDIKFALNTTWNLALKIALVGSRTAYIIYI